MRKVCDKKIFPDANILRNEEVAGITGEEECEEEEKERLQKEGQETWTHSGQPTESSFFYFERNFLLRDVIEAMYII